MKNKEINFREKLKNIPQIDKLITYCYNQLKVTLPQIYLKKIINQEIKQLKLDIKTCSIKYDINTYTYQLVKKRVLIENEFRLKPIINGTGIVLHTGFGRSPINRNLLLQSINNTYPYCNLEYDIYSNKRGERNNHISYLINSLTNSESSIVVNNNSAAVLLILNTFSENQEVIISRGELVEIGGSFRIPDVINKANCKMIEVGTTNKTHLKDYKDAITDKTKLIMIAHTSNYKVVGFTKSVDLKKLIYLAKSKKIPIFIDLGSGAVLKYDKYGLPNKKIVKEYINMGIDIISFSGDKLIGGPQAGIICGKKSKINKIHSNSLYRALRCDKITISMMESILKTFINHNRVNKENLTLLLLTRNRGILEKVGERILKNLDVKVIKSYEIKLVDSFVEAGSGSLPIQNIESKALKFDSKSLSPSKISKKFKGYNIPIVGYIKSNNFFIDLKAITKDQEAYLAKSINNCLK